MKKSQWVVSLLFVFFGLASPVFGGELVQDLTGKLHTLVKVCHEKDVDGFKSCVSSYNLGTMQNNLARSGRSLSGDLLATLAESYGLAQSTAWSIAEVNGNTARLAMIVKEPAADEAEVLCQVYRFVREADDWRFDSAYFNKASIKRQPNGNADYDETWNGMKAGLPSSVAVDGKVLAAPQPVGEIKNPASISVMAPTDLTIKVTLNGTPVVEVTGRSRSMILPQGLASGLNTLDIEVIPAEGKEPMMSPLVTIFSIGAKRIEVVKWEPETVEKRAYKVAFQYPATE